MNTFTHGDLTVAYVDAGSGPAVVMLHNGGTSSTIWRDQIDALADRYRVVAVDLPGFGSSPRPEKPARLADMVELIGALADEQGMAPALLVGNCMGTNIAASLARLRPELVAGILAVNPLTEASFSAGGLGLLHRLARVAPAPAAALRSVSRRLPVPGPISPLTLRFQLGDKGVEKELHHDPDLLACQARADQLPALVDVLGDMTAYGALDDAGLPDGLEVWIVWGEQNRVLSRRHARHLDQVMGAERVEVLAGCGHLPSIEDPAAITALIEELAERVGLGTSAGASTSPRPGGPSESQTPSREREANR